MTRTLLLAEQDMAARSILAEQRESILAASPAAATVASAGLAGGNAT